MTPITRDAPASPVSAGRPALGAYRGYMAEVGWHRLAGELARSPLWRRFHHKRWHYVSIAGEAYVVALAVIDAGYAASAFAYLFDRARRELVVNLGLTALPGAASVTERPGSGACSRFVTRRARFTIEHADSGWRIAAEGAHGFALDAWLDAGAAPPPLSAVAAIAGGVANCTHKTVGLAARGTVRADGRHFDLAGGCAALDHTSGLLARDTRWRWASATSPSLSLNLVEDFNGPVENVVWVGGELLPVGPVTFTYDARNTRAPWHIRAEDGSLELEFLPEGERREDKNLVLAKSWYVQPIGTFRGVVRPPGMPPIDVRALAGVTEDHVARW